MGFQLLAQYLGGKVEPGLKREYGKAALHVKDSFSPLFANLPETLQVWNSHGDRPNQAAAGFQVRCGYRQFRLCGTGKSIRTDVWSAISSRVVHTPHGREMLANFVHNICGCGKNWTMRNYIDQAVENIRAKVGGERSSSA